MDIKTIKEYSATIAVVSSGEIVISDTSSALDFMASVCHMTGADSIALNKEAVCEDFFKLSTGVAGEILQKFVTYNLKFAIIGDFSKYTSKPLKDFIYESNNGNHVFFVGTEEEAVNRLIGR